MQIANNVNAILLINVGYLIAANVHALGSVGNSSPTADLAIDLVYLLPIYQSSIDLPIQINTYSASIAPTRLLAADNHAIIILEFLKFLYSTPLPH